MLTGEPFANFCPIIVFSYPTALELVATRRIDLSGLTRATYTLEETIEAFKRTQKADVVKVFITC